MRNAKDTNRESSKYSLKYRSRFDIVGVMLQAAVRGATKTRLMYDAFLSHSQAEEYISFLLGKKLISLAADNKHYHPTEKGLRFLSMYAEIKDAVTVDIARTLPESQPASPEKGSDEDAKPTPEPAGGAQLSGLGVAQSSQAKRPGGVG
jgi:predicted transcriptional regulator